MMISKLLLLTLIITLASVGCSADGGRERDFAATTAGSSTDTEGQEIAADESQKPASPLEPTAVPQQNQAAEAPPTLMPAPTDAQQAAVLPVIAPAPGWDNEVWINSDGPLPLEELRGKVVLLEFWTFG